MADGDESTTQHTLGPSAPRWTHVAIRVADMDATIDWYERYTPLEVLDRREDADGYGAWLGHRDSGEHPFVLVLVQFFDGHDPYGDTPLPKLAPFNHIGIEMPKRSDVDDLAERGRADGCLAFDAQQLPPPVGYVCMLEDPDGNLVEFSHDQGVYDTIRRAVH
jgi:catechol 2,3-dioxygenase-like lactoylglutathione lyase family enzyme